MTQGGWGEKSINNLLNSIKKRRVIDLQRFIYAIGIRYVGQTTAKLLASSFVSFDNLKQKILKISKSENLENDQDWQEFIAIDGVGKKTAKAIVQYFQ